MIVVAGIVVVILSILGGYYLEQGVFRVLVQPAEWMIIFGAALGSLLIASTKNTLGLLLRHIPSVFKENRVDRDLYIEALMVLNNLLTKVRREGLVSVEADVERPGQSGVFAGARRLGRDDEVVRFICDTFRVYMITGDAHEIEQLMDLDMQTTHLQAMTPAHNLTKVAESLPGLGIVAAVLGVVLTMGKITQPPEVLGHSIGAALVGTFLGVLMCYGFVGPLATNLENRAMERQAFLGVIRAVLAGAARGATPIIAVEYGRRTIPADMRPTFEELEGMIRR